MPGKNLFLYTDADALLRADTHTADSLKILHEYQDILAAVMRESNPLLMGTTLDIYRSKRSGSTAKKNTGTWSPDLFVC